MPDRRRDSAFACIRAAVRGSHLPEDPAHAKDTLRWLLFLCPDADDALRIAALGHDIERTLPDGRVFSDGVPTTTHSSRRMPGGVLPSPRSCCTAMGSMQRIVADVSSLNHPS
ncbi:MULTISPECIES: hypothetical protein [unclassified Methanoculleus]|uniref:hypothetical protein n=1 Tax=unclassified Methanoculleus TaxID=2619537 RepID=UPI0025D7BC16|nr:hypothetical protein [Methanoculleus sp. UBA377]